MNLQGIPFKLDRKQGRALLFFPMATGVALKAPVSDCMMEACFEMTPSAGRAPKHEMGPDREGVRRPPDRPTGRSCFVKSM